MPQENHWWIVGQESTGRKVLVYGGQNETEARNKGYRTFGPIFELKMLPTRNRHEASSMVRGGYLDETGDLDGALRRVRHRE